MNTQGSDDLRTVPNVGPGTIRDLELLGIRTVSDLRDHDPRELYQRLCSITGATHDICVLDVLTAAVQFAQDGIPVPWWEYSRRRKAQSTEI